MNIFGFQIIKLAPEAEKSPAIAAPQNDDGATTVASSASAYYGVYLDTDTNAKNEFEELMTYREISQYPEIDLAVQQIVNEAIPHEDDSPQLDLVMDELEVDPQVKEIFQQEFDQVLRVLNYKNASSDIFKRWYVDGRLFYQVIIDKENYKNGILELRPIDATKIKKVREIAKERTMSGVEVISGIQEYFVYNESGFVTKNGQTTSQIGAATSGVRISTDAIVYIPSGRMDATGSFIRGYLHGAIRIVNQLRMLEDAVVITRIARAPERRIFYIDVGNLPKAKADQHVKEIMNTYRNKMVYDSKSGSIRDDKKYMSMLEDFWLPRRDGSKGTEIQTLEGAQNLNQLDDVNLFTQKLYQALYVPVSRMQPQDGFSLGRSTEVNREEITFQKFVDKLRRKFSEFIFEVFKRQLILKGIVNDAEWEEIKEKISLRFQRDNYFAELKDLEILNSRLMALTQVDQYLGKYFSKVWVQRTILKQTEEDIEKMREEIEAEAGDPTAMPSLMGGQPMPMDPSLMAGMPGPMIPQDPYAQQDDQGVPQ